MEKSENWVVMTRCYFCGEHNEILLHRRFGDLSEYKDKVVSMAPCSQCAEYMKDGVILLTIDPARSPNGWEKENLPNPYRTGGFFVMQEDAYKSLFSEIADDGIVQQGLQHRFMFIDHDAAVLIGLFKTIEEEE